MSDDFAFCHVHHEFGHIRGMIGNPFDVFADEGEPNGPGDRFRIFEHEGQQLAEQLLRQIIDEIIVGTDFSRQVGVGVDERIKAIFHHT